MKRIEKGTPGYLDYKKKVEIIRTVIYFLLVAAIFTLATYRQNKKQSSDSGGNSWLSSCRKSAGGSYHQVSLCFCRSEAGS